MNNRMAKKLKRVVNKRVYKNLEDLSKLMCELPLYWRFIYAFRIICKVNPKIEFEYLQTKHSEALK